MKQMAGITPAEWNMMECLWEKSPQTAREVVDVLSTRVGWSRSTILTMLRRLSEKKLIRCEDGGSVKLYYALLDRDEAVKTETASFVKRVYAGDHLRLMAALQTIAE